MRHGIAALLFLLLATSAQAQSQPPFAPPGLPARANDVYAQFQAVTALINSLEARLARLEGGALNNTDIAGTYRIFALQTGLFAGNSPGLVETITYTGTLTLSASGNYTGTLNGRQHDLALNGQFNAVMSTTPTMDSVSGTYSVSQNTKLTLNNFGGDAPLDLYGASGGRIFVATAAGEDPPPGKIAPMGTNVLLLFVRTN